MAEFKNLSGGLNLSRGLNMVGSTTKLLHKYGLESLWEKKTFFLSIKINVELNILKPNKNYTKDPCLKKKMTKGENLPFLVLIFFLDIFLETSDVLFTHLFCKIL